ncbi:MAG TPA: hypothetical protein GX391_01175 [Firmicutes bacterium]|nr:hypothetical protein [Bacillota bacterium]HOQ23618.1 hypothetical protein [Bacillota bacterium]HPT68062.1 hypothetical protein [Bacillota bacterium]
MKWFKWLFIIALLYCLELLCINLYMNSYIKYDPIVYKPGKGLVEAPKLNTMAHKENIKLVLTSYSEKWKEKNGEIYIQRKLYFDKDLLWNFTNKANDPEFMKKSHSEQ